MNLQNRIRISSRLRLKLTCMHANLLFGSYHGIPSGVWEAVFRWKQQSLVLDCFQWAHMYERSSNEGGIKKFLEVIELYSRGAWGQACYLGEKL